MKAKTLRGSVSVLATACVEPAIKSVERGCAGGRGGTSARGAGPALGRSGGEDDFTGRVALLDEVVAGGGLEGASVTPDAAECGVTGAAEPEDDPELDPPEDPEYVGEGEIDEELGTTGWLVWGGAVMTGDDAREDS